MEPAEANRSRLMKQYFVESRAAAALVLLLAQT
jgi:hypothetical protein